MPPPCCIVNAASRRWAKIPPISSGIAPITKQLNRVTSRPLPAPAMTRPAGKNLKSVIAAQNRSLHRSGSRSGPASAVATRRQVSSIVLSSGSPEGALSRYFMSQICCEIDATMAMRYDTSAVPPRLSVPRPRRKSQFSIRSCPVELSGGGFGVGNSSRSKPRAGSSLPRVLRRLAFADERCGGGLHPPFELGHHPAAGPAGRYRFEEFQGDPTPALDEAAPPP